MKMIKKILVGLLTLVSIQITSFAEDTTPITEEQIAQEQSIQSRINDIGSKLLNANKIDKRIIFVYDEQAKDTFLKMIEENKFLEYYKIAEVYTFLP